jgi:serine phosphatase RsbU (regulator of sigma subunit)
MATQVLEVVDGQGRRRQVPLDRPRLLIGREPSCDIHLPHPGVSRRHAQLQFTEQGRWLLQDLSSRNHVYVENRPIQQIVLDVRKPFRIAEYWLALLEAPSEARTDAEPESRQDDTAQTALSTESPWLEHLQIYNRGVLPLDEPHLILEWLAREVTRVLRPRILAIGITKPAGYSWEIVQAVDDATAYKQFLEEAEEKVASDQSSMQNWSPAPPGGPETPMCLLIPMKGRQGIIGHVYISHPNLPVVPKPIQRYLSLLAGYSALAWDNLQLGSLRQSQVEIEKELQHARQIQIDLFPPTFDVDPRLDAYAVNLPSAKVSGDYYDLIRTGPNTVAFVIADAMGHGMPAALLMAAVRAGLRMGLSLGLPWAAVFQGLDDLIRQAREDTFVTGMVGLLHLDTSELLLVSAGHPAPSILVDGRPIEVPKACLTRPWGIDMQSTWEVGKLCLKGKRWSILSFTDGVTEAGTGATRAHRTMGGMRVAAFHQRHFDQSAEDICQGLLNDLAAQQGTGSLRDDQTVLVLCSA